MKKTLLPPQNLSKIGSGNCQTPWGWAIIEYKNNAIFRLEFLGGKRFPTPRRLIADPQSQKIADYLFNNPSAFTFNPQGTAFQKEVWGALLDIPRGSLKTYQEIANAIGKPRSVRAVANAIGANPICIFIPCHRVIKSDGTLGGYSSGNGALLKQQLLLSEGINPPSEDPSYE
jgi:methylated-DNA-[protein]-cysteine S-methyltransferase